MYYIIFIEKENGKADTIFCLGRKFKTLSNTLIHIRSNYTRNIKFTKDYKDIDKKGTRFKVSTIKRKHGSCDVFIEHR